MRRTAKIKSLLVTAAAATGAGSAASSFGAAITDFKAAALSTTAQTVTNNPVVTDILSYNSTTGLESFLIQNGTTAGLEVYAFNTASGGYVPAVGDTVSVSGFSYIYNGLYEAESNASNGITLSVTKTGTAAVPGPVAFTLAGLQNGSAVGASEQSEVGTLAGVTFNGSTGTFAKSGTYSVGNGSGVFATVYVPSTDTAIIGQPIPTGTVNLTAYLGQYDSVAGSAASTNGYELDPLSITSAAVPEPTSLAAVAVAAAAAVTRRRRRA